MAAIEELIDAIRNGRQDTALALLNADPALARVEFDGATALHHAAARGSTVIAAALLDAGGDSEACDSRHQATPIGWANEFGQEGMVRFLLDRGANITLHMAAGFGLADLVRRLAAESPESVNRVDQFGAPIHHAAVFGHDRVVSDLLAVGADPDLPNANGLTPRELAQEQIDSNGSRTPVLPDEHRRRVVDGCRACLKLLE